jgi:hypothetical protein
VFAIELISCVAKQSQKNAAKKNIGSHLQGGQMSLGKIDQNAARHVFVKTNCM